LKPLASLKLTVVLFAMAMFLIFAGTLAQVEQGTFEAMDNFFRSFYAWIDLQLFVPPSVAEVPGGFPFPGGFVLIGALLINLIAAHSVRFKFNVKRSGILLTHAGLILLLGSELATAGFATEGNMTITEGSYSNFVERMRDFELAVIDSTPEDHRDVTVIPDSILKSHLTRDSGDISHPDLPFDVRIHRWMENAILTRAGPGQANPANKGLGQRFLARRRPSASGASASQSIDTPAAYATLLKDGQPLGTYMLTTMDNASPALPPASQEVEVQGKTYKLDLRFEREYKPYQLHLKDFQHEQFTGTDKPKAFKSIIRLEDPSRSENRQVLISMNNPLYYRGETFYQSAFKPDNSGTILQVVNNPAWVLPYISCGMIGGGLMLHFGMSLTRFLRRQRA
jgi:hypothetical protein